jgi:hypothetical protein
MKVSEEREQLAQHIKKYELLIFFLSLNPHEMMVIILYKTNYINYNIKDTLRKVENLDLREFYTYLYIYFYSGTKELNCVFNFLDKYYKNEIIFKYEKYGQ